MSVPNQKIVSVNKELTDKEHKYIRMNIQAMDYALKDCKGALLKVWMYFAMNMDGYKFELSSAAVCAACSITDKTYRECIKELVKRGYLVQRAKPANYYDFYEIPREVEVPKNGSIIECHTSTEIITETEKITGEI